PARALSPRTTTLYLPPFASGGRGWDGETVVDWGLWGIDLENYYAPTYSLCVSNPRNEGA
ncbi:MAG: hypothetical protein ACK5A3_21725, partial [Planctomyces sp.]